MQKKYDLSIVIPAFNEEKRISGTLEKIHGYIQKHHINAEIIVVNDGSSDKTGQVVKNIFKNIADSVFLDLKKNFGKGYAVKQGVLFAQGKTILFTDADNSTPIEELPKLIKKMHEGYDIVIGSRYLKNSNIQKKQSGFRIFVSRLGNFLINMLVVKKIKDTQCGFKLFNSKIVNKLFPLQKIQRFAFDIEILAIAQHFGFLIAEVPVTWNHTPGSKLRAVRDTLKTLSDLLFIKWHLIRGDYK